MKENAILIRQIDVLKVYVDFASIDGLERAVHAKRVSTIHTLKTQQVSQLLGIHLVGYVDREGKDINNPLACSFSGYDFLGSYMLVCKTDDKFNNYGFDEEELEAVYKYLTTGEITTLGTTHDFFEKYHIKPLLPALGIKPDIYYKKEFPYIILLRYDLTKVAPGKADEMGRQLFYYVSDVMNLKEDESGTRISADDKYYIKSFVDNEFAHLNVLIQAKGEEEVLIANAPAVVDSFLNPPKTEKTYTEDDVDTAIEEALD